MSPLKKTFTVLASVAAGALLLGAATLPAHMCHHGGGAFGGSGGGMLRLLGSLDLTDDQKTLVKAILKDERPTLEPLMDEVVRSKKALSEAVHSRTFDEKAVRAAAAESGKASADLAVEKARIVSRVRAILTDEQQDRLESIRRHFQQRLEKRVGLARAIWKEHADDFVDAL